MHSNGWALFFLQVSVMLVMALLGALIMRRLNHPPVLGELLGGIVIGPTIFGTIFPDSYAWLFPDITAINTAREAFITIGMLFFLFSAGLEVNLSHLNGRVWVIIFTSILGVAIPFGLGYVSVFMWPDLWGMTPTHQSFVLPIFIGTALSISALPVIARILIDIDMLDKELGVVVITSAVINDLVGWSLFAATLKSIQPGSTPAQIWIVFGWVLGSIILIWFLTRWLAPSILSWMQRVINWEGGFISLTAVWIFAAAAVTQKIGLHPVLGAFLVGLVVGQGMGAKKDLPVFEIIQRFALNFFAPLYFVSVGLRANFIKGFDPILILVVLLIASVGKIFGGGLGAWLGGMTHREGLAVGSGLNARGAIEIILATVALEYHIIDQRIFIALVVMALFTSMLSAPLMKKFIPPNIIQTGEK